MFFYVNSFFVIFAFCGCGHPEHKSFSVCDILLIIIKKSNKELCESWLSLASRLD
uniref:Lipoprotein n=1 Tax=Anguilla anguilla TaxID=7936 RepID=A0A0E9VHJ1_ANGAN